MLILSMRVDRKFRLTDTRTGDVTEIKILDVGRYVTRLGITAPKHVRIEREELNNMKLPPFTSEKHE